MQAAAVLIGFIIMAAVIYSLSPAGDIIADIKAKYSICSYYTLVKIIDKNMYTKYNRLIFEVTSIIGDTEIISEVTPADFRKAKIDEEIYMLINNDGTRVIDIFNKDEIDYKLNILNSFPLNLDIKEMKG